jgi:hypothetical protein
MRGLAKGCKHVADFTHTSGIRGRRIATVQPTLIADKRSGD